MTSKIKEITTTRPSTCGVSTRCDMRTLAELSLFWSSQGEEMPSMSMLVKVTLEVFRDLVLSKYNSPSVETHEEALKILKSRGLTFHASRARKRLADALASESTSIDEFVMSKPEPSRPQFTPSHPKVKEALGKMDEVPVVEHKVEDIEESQARRDGEQVDEKARMAEMVKRSLEK